MLSGFMCVIMLPRNKQKKAKTERKKGRKEGRKEKEKHKIRRQRERESKGVVKKAEEKPRERQSKQAKMFFRGKQFFCLENKKERNKQTKQGGFRGT